MTTLADVLRNPAGTGIGGVTVRATLVAASEVLTGGGAIIRETETVTASDGTWTLTLTPIDSLAVSTGAYYLITADGHRWAVDVPATGTYALDDVQVEPGRPRRRSRCGGGSHCGVVRRTSTLVPAMRLHDREPRSSRSSVARPIQR